MRAKIGFLRVRHFVANRWPNRWDILYQIGGITPCPHYICTQCIKAPYIYISYMCFFLDGAAQSPRPLLRFTPGFAAAGGDMTSLRSGYSGGLSPTPQTPQRRPQRASAQGLRLRFAQLSAPKGLCPFRLRFHRQALVLARASLRSSAAMESPPCGHGSAA